MCYVSGMTVTASGAPKHAINLTEVYMLLFNTNVYKTHSVLMCCLAGELRPDKVHSVVISPSILCVLSPDY